MHKAILIGVLLLSLLSTAVFAVDSASEESPTTDDFKNVYAEYQRFSEEGKWRESLVHAYRSYEIGKTLFGESSKNTASLAYNYGLNLMALRRNEQAEEIFRETLSMYEGIYGEKSKELIPVLMDLGHSMAKPYKEANQKKYYNRALRLTEENYGEESVNYGQRSIEAGVVLLSGANSILAKYYLYKGHKILEKNLGETAPRVGYAAFNIGKFELATRDYEDAILYLNKALASFSAPEEPLNTMELATHGFLVEAYEKLEEQDLATKHCLAIGRMTPITSVQDYQPLVKISPKYPASALRKNQEGYVTLEYEVDDSGFVRNPEVVALSGPESFVDVAIKAAEKFRYAPGFKDGKAIATAGVRNRFVFKIAN